MFMHDVKVNTMFTVNLRVHTITVRINSLYRTPRYEPLFDVCCQFAPISEALQTLRTDMPFHVQAGSRSLHCLPIANHRSRKLYECPLVIIDNINIKQFSMHMSRGNRAILRNKIGSLGRQSKNRCSTT